MGKLKEYEAFFEALAVKYKPIGHDPDNGIVRFGTFSPDAIIAKKREKSGLDFSSWCLIAVEPDFGLSKNHSSMYRTAVSAGFEIVIDPSRNKVGQVDYQEAAFAMCEEIVAYLVQLRRENGFELGSIDDSDFEYYPQPGLHDKYVGFGVAFSYSIGFARSKTINPDNWND